MEDKVPILKNAISVSELNATIHACMDAPIFQGLEVFGEISGYKLSGPHAYFTLKDQNAQISCVRFYASRDYMPKDGESVILRGRLDYYVKGGRLTLQVSSITPVGKGLLFLQFEKLKEQLTKEGIFDEAHKVPIPKYPKNVLVVTSKTGAVIRDIVTTIRRKNPVINIVIRDVRVQGEGAGKEIASVLKRVDKLGYDVIIIARGGGSLEDLAPFYDETLVRAVYAMDTPVVSAVGHETDFSLCDFVADYRAATPTAAGELVAYDYYDHLRTVKEHAKRLGYLATKQIERKSMRVNLAVQKLGHQGKTFYSNRVNKVLGLVTKLGTLAQDKATRADFRLEKAMNALDNLSPLKTLKRGYFAISVADKSVASVRSVKVGDNLKAQGVDGVIEATVTKVLEGEKNG
ncbi:MAG: exodeoxyribonuclease VII large subunit [Clostridia bacterium]|nr:exodeoxyribonuclease VII large subunit [Clostridia bacterium]